jgi:flavin reductase (DIM6/NTAB) family NADH-FMN oxidoreductase RutF
VTVITTLDEDGKPAGLTANSFSSVSLDPPLILWSQSLKAPSHSTFAQAERFVVNILSEGQIDISNRFARGGQDKFAGVPTRAGLGGLPMIEGCSAYLECIRVQSYPGGDHSVFLGEVQRIECTQRAPLVFASGKYMVVQAHDLGAMSIDMGVASLSRVHAVKFASTAIAKLGAELGVTLGLCVWGNHGPTMVRWEPSRDPISQHLRTGLVLPLTTSASGICFAAWLPPGLTEAFETSEFETLDEAAIAAYHSAVAAAKATGVARLVASESFNDMYGRAINALSFPVFDQSGDMVLAITAVGDAQTMDADPLGPVTAALRQCARALSRQLGYPPATAQ